MVALGLCCCEQAFSSCGERGPLCCSVRASHCSGFSCCGARALGAWAQLLRGMWDLPGPGLKPLSPALTGGFLTTAPPGKSHNSVVLYTRVLHKTF